MRIGTWGALARCLTAMMISILLFGAGCSHLKTEGHSRQKAQLLLQLATEQFNQRNFAEALKNCRLAIEADPEYAASYNHLALVYMETDRLDAAQKAFKQALALKPDYPEVFNNMGVLLNKRGAYKSAMEYFKKALANETYETPENAYTNMGYSHYRMGELREAKVLHRKALDIVPQFCLADKNLGDVYAKERNYHKAAECYRNAVLHCPLYQESHFKLGVALMKDGRRETAVAELEKLLSRHQSGPFWDKSQQVLKYLK